MYPTHFCIIWGRCCFFLGKWSDTFAAKLSNQAMRRGALKQDFWKN